MILATGAHKSIASSLAKQLDLFECVHATDKINLTGKKKADLLVETLYGVNGFDYAGNSSVDLHVWRSSRMAIAINASSSVVKKLKAIDLKFINISFSERETSYLSRTKSLLEHMRIKQWIKNSLIFIPLLLSQSYVIAENVFIVLWPSLHFLATSLFIC